MFKETLLSDGKDFKKNKKIYKNRPSKYWLVFFKKFVLVKQRSPFNFWSLLFLIPLAILMLMLFGTLSDDYVPVLIISLFVTFIIFGIGSNCLTYPFVHITSFYHLAKFIIDIKGDVYRDLMSIRLNFGFIESNIHFMDPSKIGLKPSKTTKYKPYELERYKAQFQFKDGTVCNASLHQISLKVITTKRRTSGKMKTKRKYKHKFLYILLLKLKSNDYNIATIDHLNSTGASYSITHSEEDGFHYLKVKFKEKVEKIHQQLIPTKRRSNSNFTKMIEFLKDNNLVTPVKKIQ